MAWGTRQSLGTVGQTSGATLVLSNVTFPANVLVVVSVVEKSTSAAANYITDPTNGNYNVAVFTSDAANIGISIQYIWNGAAITNSSLTYTPINSANECEMSAFYVTGQQTSADPGDYNINGTAVYSSAGTQSPSLASGTPTNAGELFVACIGYSTTGTFTQDTTDGWAAPPTALIGSTQSIAGGTLVNSGAGSKTFAPTLGTSSKVAMAIAAFLPAASGDMNSMGVFCLP